MMPVPGTPMSNPPSPSSSQAPSSSTSTSNGTQDYFENNQVQSTQVAYAIVTVSSDEEIVINEDYTFSLTASNVFISEPGTSSLSKSYASVCAYINYGCTSGPYLNQRKLSRMPAKYGPGSLNRVLRETVQTFIDCAENAKNIFGLLKKGDGKVIITANFDGRTYTCHLPPVDNVSAFWNYLEELFEDLMCCENIYTSLPIEGICSKCASKGIIRQASEDCSPSPSHSQLSEFRKRRWSSCPSQNNSINSASRLKSIKRFKPYLQYELEDNFPGAIQPGKAMSKPTEWSIDDVIHYICSVDKNLTVYADVFRKQEIDGKAFLLLDSNMMMNYMGLKLGPALKIYMSIERLKVKRY